MRKIFSLIATLVISFSAWAVTISPTAGGQVSTLVTNVNETSLTIVGVIDVRDFVYIGEKLTKLTTLNLERATIAAYTSDKPLLGNQYNYQAEVVPHMSLASLPALQTISFPTSATTIGMGALAGCINLKNVTIAPSTTNIEAYAFAGCSKITTITIPASVTRLGDGAFTRCTSLTTVNLGSGTNATFFSIGDEAFLGCAALASITFNNRLLSIGKRAFAGTQIKALDLSGYTALETIDDYAFAKAPLTTVKFPNSVRAIGTGALLYSSALSVTIPTNLEQVPPFAFAGASRLSSIDLSKTQIDTIGDYAFYHVNQPTELSIPSTVSHIGTKAMVGMTGLTKLSSRATEVPSLGDDVWQGLNQPNIILSVPNQAIPDYMAAEQWKEFNIQSSFIMGDVNNDGIVDVEDVNEAINHILKLPVSPNFIFAACDIDNNGIIDVEDVNKIINIILKIDNYAPVNPNTGDVIIIDDFSIDAGQTRTVDLKLAASIDYTALQCDIILPAGLCITNIEKTDITQNLTLATGEIDGGWRLLCFGTDGNPMSLESENIILRLTLTADDDLASLATINIDNSVLATQDCQALHCPSTTAYVSSTTGVNDISNNSVRVWAQSNTLIIETSEPTTAQLIAINGTSTPLVVMGGHNEYSGIDTGIYIVRIGNESFKVAIHN